MYNKQVVATIFIRNDQIMIFLDMVTRLWQQQMNRGKYTNLICENISREYVKVGIFIFDSL